MRIYIDIPAAVIANMMVSFIESPDPVTNAWCSKVRPGGRRRPAGHNWYSRARIYQGEFLFIVDEEGTRGVKPHTLDRAAMIRGLRAMAKHYPDHFAQIIADNTDAPCAGLFIQCCLFGEEKYS